MPTFICEELFAQCQVANVGDRRAQDACETNIEDKCGDEDPPSASGDDDDEDESSTSTDASTTATTTSDSGSDSEATGDNVTTTDEEDFAAPTLMPGNGVAAVAAIGVLAYLV